MAIIVNRFTDISNLKKLKPPLLIYGRRKTGKTFLIKQLFPGYNYFFVRRDKSIYWENREEELSYKEFIRTLSLLKEPIIIDEFHRLGNSFLEYLHMKAPKNIILVTSTLFLAKKLLKERSPILGLFLAYQVNLIDERDIIYNLANYLKGKELIEKSVFFREPTLLRWFDLDLGELINFFKLSVPSLISEIFIEEDRKLTERYEGILRAISVGKYKLNEITNFLYSKGLINSQNPSLVKPYLSLLLEMGLLKRYKEFGKNKYYYYLTSPLIDLYFYLDEKYNFSERDLGKEYFYSKIPFYVEDFFRELLAKLFDCNIVMIRKPQLEIDIALTKFKRLFLVGEVKWKNNISEKEIKNVEEKLNKFKDAKKILIVPSKESLEVEPEKVEVWDVKEVVSAVSRYYKEPFYS